MSISIKAAASAAILNPIQLENINEIIDFSSWIQ